MDKKETNYIFDAQNDDSKKICHKKSTHLDHSYLKYALRKIHDNNVEMG